MFDNLRSRILLVGAGLIAQEYAKILHSLEIKFDVVGRGEDSAKEFTSKTGTPAFTGGLELFFKNNVDKKYTHSIVTTGIDDLCNSALTLLQNNIKNILVEKPGGMNIKEIETLNNETTKKNAKVLIAYNRRFYSSTLAAQKIIKEDGGVSSFHFEFTEWAHVIEPLKTPTPIKNNWFLANSSHVVDLSFYLGGQPRELSTYRSGNLSWHKHSKYAGAGITDKNVLFSYHANWEAPGRWSVEILTAKHRLYFKPMESLQIQNLGSVAVNPFYIDDLLDKNFKPGLYKQTEAFINNNLNNFCSIADQLDSIKYYNQISGYESV